MAGDAKTNRRDGSTARRVDGYLQQRAFRGDGGIAASGLDRHPLPDAVSLLDLNRVRQPQRRRVGLVGGVGPVALILHLPEIALEPNDDLAARSGVRDRLHIDERLMG